MSVNEWQPHKGDDPTIVGELNQEGRLETGDGVFELPDHRVLQKEVEIILKNWEENPTVAIAYQGEDPEDIEGKHDYVVLRAQPSVSPLELSEVLNNFSGRIK